MDLNKSGVVVAAVFLVAFIVFIALLLVSGAEAKEHPYPSSVIGYSDHGGWATHQVAPMRGKADEIRRKVAYARSIT